MGYVFTARPSSAVALPAGPSRQVTTCAKFKVVKVSSTSEQIRCCQSLRINRLRYLRVQKKVKCRPIKVSVHRYKKRKRPLGGCSSISLSHSWTDSTMLQRTPADKSRKGSTQYEAVPAPPPAYTIVSAQVRDARVNTDLSPSQLEDGQACKPCTTLCRSHDTSSSSGQVKERLERLLAGSGQQNRVAVCVLKSKRWNNLKHASVT